MPEKRTKKGLRSTKHHLKRKTQPKKAAKKVTKPAKAKKAGKAAAEVKAHDGELSVFDLNGKAQETLKLDPMFNSEPVNKNVLYQAVLMYQAGEREGTAATKDRGHVRGGGKKPWKQKGTGQARHGSRRSPLWRGGGVTFGPMPRDYSYALPVQLKRKAVVEGMKDKVANGKVVLVKGLDFQTPKTKQIANLINVFKLEKPLILVDQKSENLLLASRNIHTVSVKTADEVNALDVVSHRECLMTKAAYTGLVKRLKA